MYIWEAGVSDHGIKLRSGFFFLIIGQYSFIIWFIIK